MAVEFQDILIRDMACKYKMSESLMREIVSAPILFLKNMVRDDNKYGSFRIPYFGVFTQKPVVNKQSRLDRLYNKLKSVAPTKDIPADKLADIEAAYEAKKYDVLVSIADEFGVTLRNYKTRVL